MIKRPYMEKDILGIWKWIQQIFGMLEIKLRDIYLTIVLAMFMHVYPQNDLTVNMPSPRRGHERILQICVK